MRLTCLILFLWPCFAGSQSLFTLVAPERSGVTFQNTIKETPALNVLSYEYFYNGGGVATGDLNNDGLPDIVFTSNMEQPSVYLNKGNFVFDDISKRSKVHADGWKTGVSLADVNGDGWLDIYICRSGNGEEENRRNLLFINQKNGTFREEAAQYGVDDKGNSTQAVFFDYDRDGYLDLFLLRHSIKRIKNVNVAYMKTAYDSLGGDRLYHNDRNGHFTNVSGKTGIIGNPICFGLGVAVADFNEDGWPDLYVTNDYDEDDYLYINQKDGTFRESLRKFMGQTSKFSMGCDVADVNNDGLSDLMTLDMLPEDNRRQKLLKGPDGYDHFQMLINSGYYYQYMRNMLQVASKNNGRVRYSEMGQLAGISNTDWSWSVLFGDYDLDGRQDIFVTNGYKRDYTNLDFLKFTTPDEIRKSLEAGQKPDLFGLVQKMPASQVKSYLFRNKGDGVFDNTTLEWGMGLTSLSNGAAYADFDNDGDWDLVINNINQPAFVWQNHAEDGKNNYLKLRFIGAGRNTFGLGAKVTVESSDGFRQLQQLQAVHGFQSSSEPCLIFGLGKREWADVRVEWPDGKVQVLSRLAVNKTVLIDEKNAGSGAGPGPVKTGAAGPGFVGAGAAVGTRLYFTELPADSMRFRHAEDYYNDFKREPLLPHQYSREGPALAAGDVDGDGKVDFFVGGAKGQAGVVYHNEGGGRFAPLKVDALATQTEAEQVNALLADMDHDGDLDLYVVSGGNEDHFADHIYWNDGHGNFTERPGALPVTGSSGKAAVAFDLEKDGFPDIFRGGQVTTGGWPAAPVSYLFHNEHGVLKDVTPEFLRHIGMVNTAVAADVNGDGIADLIIAGEFMPVTILYGLGKTPYFSMDSRLVIPHSSGWWNCLRMADIDGDGDLDIIAGNEGLNCQYKPGVGQPLTVDAADADNNGSLDAILSCYIQGKSYPVATRDELIDEVPSMKSKFPTYAAYADATVKDIFTAEAMSKALHLEAEEFRSGVFVNEKGTFRFVPFPTAAQAFPVRDVLLADVGGRTDWRTGLLLTGNNYAVRAQWGREDAGNGLMLSLRKDGRFDVIHNSGLETDRDARGMIRIDDYILVANNNDTLQIFHIN